MINGDLNVWKAAFLHAAVLMGFSTGECALPADSPVPMDKPYAPLMIATGGGLLRPAPTDADLRQIAETWRFVNSHAAMVRPERAAEGPMAFWAGPTGGRDKDGRTLGENIKAINADFVLSNYRNGSYISQNCPKEAEEVETLFPLGIAVWNTGAKLNIPLTVEATQVALAPPPQLPKGAPAIYPFKASTTDSDHSKSAREYVAWVRLGEEVLRIDSIEAPRNGALEMKVRRGLWGTRAAPHSIDENVFQPVYIGSVSEHVDSYLAGIPDTKAPQLGIRYALQQQNPKFHQWLGDKCQAIFDEGYDVAWLDVSVSTWYNNANAYGHPITPWNLEMGQLMDNPTYREYQQRKIDALFKRFPDKKFFVNNVKGSCYFAQGQDRRLLTGEVGHHPVSGGSMEMYAKAKDEPAWREIANMTLDFVNSGFWGVAWSKGPGRQYRQFAYATFLLAYNPESRLLFGAGEGASVHAKPDSLFYWDLGQPVKRFKTIDEAKRPNEAGIYQRDFSKGLVLVNPTNSQSPTIDLGRELFDPDAGSCIAQVQIKPMAAKILLTPIP